MRCLLYNQHIRIASIEGEYMAETKKVRVAEVYEFYAELKGFEKKIYRRFIVKSSDSMMKLASILIYIFNGMGTHIYDFKVPRAKNLKNLVATYTPSILEDGHDIEKEIRQREPDWIVQIFIDEDMDMMDAMFMKNELGEIPPDRFDAREMKIKKCVHTVDDTMDFRYDFGDGWQFVLTLKNIYNDLEHTVAAPSVIEGKGLGIIEDCGGISDLADLMETFKNKSDGYEEMVEWLGTDEIDFETFDIEKCNQNIVKEVRALDREYRYID